MKEAGCKFPQTLSNEIRFRIKLKKKQAKSSYILANCPQRNSIQNQIQTFWMEKAGQKFLYLRKFSSTEFDLESNWNFLNGKIMPVIPTSLQIFFQRYSIWNQIQTSWMEEAGQKFSYLRKLPPTKFYLESNWKFLNERGRPQISISPQTLFNEIRFKIKLKLSE